MANRKRSSDARLAFAEIGKNFMTPVPLSYYETDDYYIELSTGEAFGGGDMYGVTVMDKKTRKLLHDKNKPFYNRGEANDYIESL